MNPFAELISIIIGIYVNIVLLRFFLQYFRADFYNPLSQFIVKATDPLILPIRKIVPGFAGLDFSSLVLAWLISIASVIMVAAFSGYLTSLNIAQILVLPLLQLINGCFSLFMFLIFVRAIMSWFMSAGYNPMFAVVGQLTEPLLAKFRRILPPSGGFDFSPIVALLALLFVSRLINFYVFPVVEKMIV